MGKKNKYVQKARRRELLGELDPTPAQTEGNVKSTAIATGRDLIVGALGGGLVGAAVGRHSLVVGAVISATGHYMGKGLLTTFGIGMMSSGTYQAINGLKGLDGMDGVKERVKAFTTDFKKRLYLDKVLKGKKGADNDVNGMGDVEYYNYPELRGSEEDNLREIERQIAAGAMGDVQEEIPVLGMDDLIERNL